MSAQTEAKYLIAGEKIRWGADKGVALGAPVTITFSIPDANVHNLTYTNITQANETQIKAFRAALDYIASFTNIKFVETTANEGNLQIINADLGAGLGGQAPNVSYGNGGYAWGVVAMNNKEGWRLDDNAYIPGELSKDDVGGAAWQTLIHEIAHTLGIKHPHDANAAGDPGSIMPAGRDNLTQSSMSYTAYANSKVTVREIAPDGRHFFHTNNLKPTTFGISDIAALQYLYGVNTSSAGNKTFAFKPDQPIYMTISDNGPNNTVDVSALTGQNTISLVGGTFSDLAISPLYPEVIGSGAYNGTRALAIAYGVNVANVIGGSGVDRVTGNAIANNLYGRAGADVLNGAEGGDNLYGGAGADRLVGGAGFDYARYDDANYGRLVVSLAKPSLNTGAAKGDTYDGIEGVIGGLGSDTITGNAAVNTLRGGGGNDVLNGGLGADQLEGGTGDDTFYVDNARDKITELAGGGIDKVMSSVTHALAANVENLTLTGKAAIKGTGNGLGNAIAGNAAKNVLSGGLGADVIRGWGGDDRIVGGAGADKLYGGSGKAGMGFDTFVFTALSDSSADPKKGQDTIFDFAHGDKIDLSILDANGKAKGSPLFTFIEGKAFSGHAGEVRFEKGKSGTDIYVNTTNDKHADMGIHLASAITLVKGDFVL